MKPGWWKSKTSKVEVKTRLVIIMAKSTGGGPGQEKSTTRWRGARTHSEIGDKQQGKEVARAAKVPSKGFSNK